LGWQPGKFHAKPSIAETFEMLVSCSLKIRMDVSGSPRALIRQTDVRE